MRDIGRCRQYGTDNPAQGMMGDCRHADTSQSVSRQYRLGHFAIGVIEHLVSVRSAGIHGAV